MVTFWLRGTTIALLLTVLAEELFPEALAKPIVVTTVFVSIGMHLWAWKKAPRPASSFKETLN